MAARRAEGQWTHEVCRPPQWVSDSLTVWIWVQQVFFFWACRGLEEGVSALAALQTHANGGGVTSHRHCGGSDQLQWTVRVYKRWSVRNTAPEMIYIDGHCVGGWRCCTCTNVTCTGTMH